MVRANVLNLISKIYTPDLIGQMVPLETTRQVYCDISSVSADEMFNAGQAGFKPEFRATMFEGDYNGEDEAELDGVVYSIYRTYLTRGNNIELYFERKAGVD